MRKIVCVETGFLAALLLPCAGLNAAPFTNGSFEIISNHAAIASNTSPVINPGDTWLAGWTIGGPGGGDISVANGTVNGLNPYDGQQWIAFNGNDTAPGGIVSQTFDTMVGQTSKVTFAVGMMGSGNVSLTATAIGSNNVLLASNYCVPANSGEWALFELDFTAVSTNTTLVFLDSSSQTVAVDLALDDVAVRAQAISPPMPVLPPSIVTSPASQTANAGDSVVFTASSSDDTSTVQWYLINWQGTNAIAGASNTTLSLTAGSASPGGYFAEFSNTGGTAATSVADLAVLGLPFTNGSFEIISRAAIPANTALLIYPANTWLTGWTVGGPGNGDVSVVNGSGGGLGPYNGQQWIDFNAGNTAPGGILSQTFTTTVGQYYLVTFAVGENGSGNVSLTATAVASSDTLLASNSCVPASGVWNLFQLGFTATTTNTTLVFLDSSPPPADDYDLTFDDVTVTATQPVIPPSVVTSPVSQTVNAGAGVVFTASAGGGASTVQWYLINWQGTNAISGATSTTLNLTASNTTPGGYFAEFSNTGGTAATSVADLAVLGLPFTNGSFEIMNHAAIASGSGVEMNVGDTWLTGWTVGGPGGDVGPHDELDGNMYPYDGQILICYNGGNTPPGGILSQTFTTTVGYYYSVVFAVGQIGSGDVSLTATAVGLSDSLLASNYCVPTESVWTLFQLDFIATTTNTTLVFLDSSPPPADAVDLLFDDVIVTATQPATPPSVVTSPVSQTVNAGAGVVFTASAGGGASTVQWYLINYQGTNAISGATNATLNLTASNTTPGGYFAEFSNSGGTAATSVANLAVLGLPFTNGSFEIISCAAIPSSQNDVLNPGATWLTGWTVGGPGGGDIRVCNGVSDGLNPYDGQQLILFNGANSAPGGILSQTFTTVVGTAYKVTFALGQAGSGNVSLTATAVAANDVLIASNYYVPTESAWTLFQLDFTATTTNTTLVFLDSSLDTVAVDTLFDDVTVLAVPTSGMPVVNTSPVSQTANSGALVSFSASAAGSPSAIQWYLGSNPVAGGTASPLAVTASDATAGSYTAVFSNSYGTATTAVAVLTVVDPPVIAVSPDSMVVLANTEVTLTASATGGPSSVQWYFGTSPISGATSTNLTFMAEVAGTGDYFAIFRNGAGTATSAVANVTVNAGPFTNGSFELINNHAAIAAGNNAVIYPTNTWLTGWTVGGTGDGDVFVMNGDFGGAGSALGPYAGQQWIDFNGGNTPPGGSLSQTFLSTVGESYAVSFAVETVGSGSGSMSITATALGSNNAVLASHYCAPATRAITSDEWTLYSLAFTANSTNTTLVFLDSSDATIAADICLDDVIVISAPVIVISPASQTNLLGATVTFTASASGSPATVQWFQGATPILNATNAILSFTVNAGSGGNYTAVFTNAAGSATTAVAVLTVSIPACLTQQPQSITTNVGATVTFAGGAGGTAPVSFQWQFDGTNISGATDESLVLTNAQPANAGSYTLVVSNPYGTNTSASAALTFISALQVVSGTVAGPGVVTVPTTSVPVTVPVNLLATGSEFGVLFNVDYDTTLLTYTGATLGSGAQGGVNGNQPGQLGVILESASGSAFAAGTQQVVQLTFQAVLVRSNTTTTLSFGSQPTVPGISDVNGNPIPATFVAGSLAITPVPLEGHVALTGNEGNSVGITDWVQEGRFAAGLDQEYILTNAAEFQQADCAPRATLGDGSCINVADWVQVGRYALGLDPPTAAGGPTNEQAQTGSVKAGGPKAAKAAPQTGSRTISIVPVTTGATTDTVAVQMASQGNESSLQFGVAFDPTALSFVSATTGSGASGARLISNSNNIAAGQLGIVVGLMPPMTFAAGSQQLVKLAFKSISYSNTTSVAFSDTPIARQLVDASASTLSAAYQNTSFQIAGQSWPTLDVTQTASNVILSWPYSPTILGAQWTTNLGANWTNTGGTPVTNGDTLMLTLPAPTNATLYRLYGQ